MPRCTGCFPVLHSIESLLEHYFLFFEHFLYGGISLLMKTKRVEKERKMNEKQITASPLENREF